MKEDVNDGFLNTVIEAFLAETPSRLKSLRSALAREDAAAVRWQAHGLKSAGAFIGIVRFTGLCREMETLASAGDTAGAAELLAAIAAEYVRAEEDLKRWPGGGRRV